MFKRTRFGHRRHSFRCYENHFFAETACGVITSPSMFGHAPLKVICSTDVVPSCAAQNVNPSHRKAGSAGTRTRNQRLKRALLYRLSYRPRRKRFLIQIGRRRKIVTAPLQKYATGAFNCVYSWLRTRSNRAANFVVDSIETPTDRRRSLPASRVANHRRHAELHSASDSLT